MPELIDKKETIAKVFALRGFFVDQSNYEFNLISAIIHRCCEEINKQPTIEADIDCAAILRLCNEIEMIIVTVCDTGYTLQVCDEEAIMKRIKAIRKELTGDAGTD